MENMNLDSTNYDVAKITNYDRRMKRGEKDAILFHGLGFFATVIATVCMFVFGSGDPAGMVYFLGLPLWFSGGVVIYLIMFIIGMVHLQRSETFSLAAREHKKGDANK